MSPRQYVDDERKLSLNVSDTKWDFYNPDDESTQLSHLDLELKFVARAPRVDADTQATLTMRVDKGTWPSAQRYADKWLKEYPKFGYEYSMSKKMKYGQLDGIEIELASTSSNRKIRQFIVHRPEEMWVFTCTSDKKYFNANWSACERILKTAHTNL